MYQPYQKVFSQYPQIPLERFQLAVQLIEADGSVYSGAEAILRALTKAKGKGWLYWLYCHIPGFAFITEICYQFVARNRSFFSKLMPP